MIGRLRGILLEKRAPELVLDVHGVGYELQAPLGTIAQLPALGQEVVLYTHLAVREDAQQLFAFWRREERDLFRALIRVSGIGPKLGLAILSGMDADEFVLCVQRGDSATLKKLPGIGKKTAERLVIEMRDGLGDWIPGLAPAVPAMAAGSPAAARNRMVQDAESALIALGYKPAEAARAVNAVLDDAVEGSEQLIRRALKGMAAGM
jgi:Holliday junction DNA helicase RuvA